MLVVQHVRLASHTLEERIKRDLNLGADISLLHIQIKSIH
jgi:hypothetical protein